MSATFARIALWLASLLGEPDTALDRWTAAEDARNDALWERVEQDDDKASEEALRRGETYVPWHEGGP